MNYFDDLSTEILVLIVLFLSIKDAAKLAQVDKRFRNVVYNHIKREMKYPDYARFFRREMKYPDYARFFNRFKELDKKIARKNNESTYLEIKNIFREIGLRVGFYGTLTIGIYIVIASKSFLKGLLLGSSTTALGALEFWPKIVMGRKDGDKTNQVSRVRSDLSQEKSKIIFDN